MGLTAKVSNNRVDLTLNQAYQERNDNENR